MASLPRSRLAEAKMTTIYKQTGKDVRLDVEKPVTLGVSDEIIWTVNGTKSVAKSSASEMIIFSDYSGRADCSLRNQTLFLKCLQRSDSGVYKARIHGDENTDVAEYKVTVLDPVSPVKLTVKSCSSDSSNLTVTCSTQDSLINRTFTCDDQSCSEERGERAEFTTPAASLKVYQENNSIICDHRNPVSRTEDVRKIEDSCAKKNGFETDPQHNYDLVISLASLFPLFLLIIAGLKLVRRIKKKTKNKANTLFEV